MANSKIHFINVRHEQIAAHAADGYARVTGKASVLLTHLGPGLTNAATGVANAALDCIPMVVIAGDVPTHYYGKHPHQEVNLHADASQYEIYRPFVKRAWRVESRRPVPRDHREGVPARRERPARPGAGRRADGHLLERRSTSNAVRPCCAQRQDVGASPRSTIETADENRPRARRGQEPGDLCRRRRRAGATPRTELRAFVEHMAIPVAHSLMGKGALPDDHPLVLGMTGFWGTKFINDKCLGADWILGLGTRFKEADCSSWEPQYTFAFPPTKLIHIDIDPTEIGRNFPTEIGAVADLKQALKTLTRVAKELCAEGRAAAEACEREIADVAPSSWPATKAMARATTSR